MAGMISLRYAAIAIWFALGLLTAGSAILDVTNWHRNVLGGAVFAAIGASLAMSGRTGRWALLLGPALVFGLVLLAAASFRIFGEGWAVFG